MQKVIGVAFGLLLTEYVNKSFRQRRRPETIE